MDRNLFVVLDVRWMLDVEPNPKRLGTQQLCPLGTPRLGHLQEGCNLLVKYRDPTNNTCITDDSARLTSLKGALYIKSAKLSEFLLNTRPRDRLAAFFFEGTESDARCVVDFWDGAFLPSIEADDPSLRLHVFDLPPITSTLVDALHIVSALYRKAGSRDPELFALHSSRFLDSPHIITALFTHLFSIRTEDNIHFPIQVKKIGEQLRALLIMEAPTRRIRFIPKSHLDLWAGAQGKRFGFLDGGVARIPALPGLEPMALRVGVYSVRPGVAAAAERENWTMKPFVLGDLIDSQRRTVQRPDPRRFREAARYTLEPLMGLLHLRCYADTCALLLHGPLVNQFAEYDEGEPNYVPFLSPQFLASVNLNRERILQTVQHIPNDAQGAPMWNQFMAVYAYVMNEIHSCPTPIAGVVERPTGRAVTNALLADLEGAGVVNSSYVQKVKEILEQYDITDDFLFGCILREGEYLIPLPVEKNLPRRARERWQPVVRQYPRPHALMLKSEDASFPFRVELNPAAVAQHEFLARFLYHTARLLPRYSFPVGLDIADKYAKIPDWISRGISTELSAAVLRRAMRTGDAHIVTQIRLLLARGPRDFFFRPSARSL
jgi:hypothetical protein